MTCREKLKIEHPEKIDDSYYSGICGCPSHYDYLDDPEEGCDNCSCNTCWDREIPEESTLEHFDSIRPSIKDSGDRTEFASGAVRDMHEGKGRCDLLPLDVVADVVDYSALEYIACFVESGETRHLISMIQAECGGSIFDCIPTMILEVAKHFEEGAKKYGDNNWRKGIPVRCYIDSAVRHYLKYLRGDKDEPHDRAFCWNILCCIWTCRHKPELNDYAKKGESE